MRRAFIAVLVIAATIAAGCGGATPAPTTGATVTHAFGTTEVPANPQRIVALSFEEDALATVGLSTVGHWDNTYEPGRPYPWQDGTVDLSHSEPVVDAKGVVNVERIAALQPDLILATNASVLDQSLYDA